MPPADDTPVPRSLSGEGRVRCPPLLAQIALFGRLSEAVHNRNPQCHQPQCAVNQ